VVRVRLTEFAAEVERLCSRTPLQTVDTSVWSPVYAELLVAARELVQPAFFVVLDVTQQLLETTVPKRRRKHACIVHGTA